MQFRLLGALEVTDDGAPVEIPSGKCSAALTVLLLRANRRVSADKLVEALWGERPPAQAKNAVQVYVSTLRKSLGPGRIDSDSAGYRLRVDAGELDIERFEDLTRGGANALARGEHKDAVTLLNQALSWWRGPALGGPLGAEFAAPDAARLEERHEVAIEDRIEALLALGLHANLVPELEALVAAQPLRERRRAHLILALYRCGQQAAALRAYDALRVMLRDELGLNPSPELAELEAAILRQSEALAWAPPTGEEPDALETNLPKPTNVFVDREIEQVEVRGAVRRHRHVTLVGPGGVGKTRFAIELGWEMVRERAGEGWFVDLTGTATATELETAVAAAFGFSDQADRSVLDALQDRLGDGRTIIILDGCERLGDHAPPFVAAVLERCPGVTILATSRRRLGCPDELTWNMNPMTPAAAAELFVARATALDPTFGIRVGEEETLAHVCAQLDGIPLAIELAAARAPYVSLDELDRRLADRFAVLRGGRGVAPRHRTLAALIEWSYETLTEVERTVFRRFSVFEAGASLIAAETVCADASIPQSEVLHILVELAGASLMSVQRVGGAPRYRMLDTIREFAQTQLAAAGEAAQAQSVHRAFFLAFAEEGNARIDSADEKAVVESFNSERDNLIAAFHSALAAGSDEAVRLGAALWSWWAVIGFVRDGVALIDAALQAHSTPRHAWLEAMVGSGRLVEQVANFDDAERRYDTAILGATEAGNLAIGSRARGLLGHLCMQRGDVERAQALHTDSLALAESAGDQRLRLRAILNLGNMEWNADRLDAAAQRYEEALALGRALPMPSATAAILGNLAGVIRHRDARRAETLLQEAIAIHVDLGNRRGEGIALSTLVNIARDGGNLAEARAYANAAVDAFREVGDRWAEARALNGLGTVLRNLGDLDGAESAFDASLRVTVELGDPTGESQAMHNLGYVAYERGDREAARRLYGDAAAVAETAGQVFQAANSWGALGELELDEAHFEVARECLDRSRLLYTQAERPDRVEEVDETLDRLRLAEAATP